MLLNYVEELGTFDEDVEFRGIELPAACCVFRDRILNAVRFDAPRYRIARCT